MSRCKFGIHRQMIGVWISLAIWKNLFNRLLIWLDSNPCLSIGSAGSVNNNLNRKIVLLMEGIVLFISLETQMEGRLFWRIWDSIVCLRNLFWRVKPICFFNMLIFFIKRCQGYLRLVQCVQLVIHWPYTNYIIFEQPVVPQGLQVVFQFDLFLDHSSTHTF